MSFNPGNLGTGAYATNAATLWQNRVPTTQSGIPAGSSGRFSTTMAQASSTAASSSTAISSSETTQTRQQGLASLQSLFQAHKSGANIMQASQSLYGNTYASASDYLQALAQTANQSVSTSSISTSA